MTGTLGGKANIRSDIKAIVFIQSYAFWTWSQVFPAFHQQEPYFILQYHIRDFFNAYSNTPLMAMRSNLQFCVSPVDVSKIF